MFGRKRLETGPFLDGETKKRGNERGRGGGGGTSQSASGGKYLTTLSTTMMILGLTRWSIAPGKFRRKL